MYILHEETEGIKLSDSTTPRVVNLEEAIARAARISNPTGIIVVDLSYTTIEVNQIGALEVTNLAAHKGMPISLQTQTYDNGSDAEQEHRFETTTSTTNSVAISTTLGFRYKLGINAKASIPGIAEVGSSHEFEFSLSDTTTKTVSKTETFTDVFPIKVPPHSTIEATSMVFDSMQSPDYTQKLQIKATGGTYSPTKEGFKVYICVWENYPFGPQTWYYHSLGGWLSRLKEEFTYISPDEVGFTVKGKIASVNGKNMQCTVKQKPYLGQAPMKVTVLTNEVGNTSNIVHEVESLEEIGKPDNVE